MLIDSLESLQFVQAFKSIPGPVQGLDSEEIADGLEIGKMRWQKAVHEVSLSHSNGSGKSILIDSRCQKLAKKCVFFEIPKDAVSEYAPH